MTGKTLCGCSHPLAIHIGPDGSCRVNGCPCAEFRARGATKPTGRVVSFEIPDGYALTVQLVPVEASDGS